MTSAHKEFVIATYDLEDDTSAYTPYGAVNDFFHYTGIECMLSGPFDTGKTLGMLQKLVGLMWTFPNTHCLLVRKTYSSLLSSALVTLYDKVLPVRPDSPESEIQVYGGSQPSYLIWPNGSRLRIAGLDDPQKVLSAEYDFVAVPQAEELSLHDWESLLSRTSGRAGNAPWSQLMGDCNPDVPLHWIQQREGLKKFEVRHTDNPTLFKRDRRGNLVKDASGNPVATSGGEKRIKILQSMTGLRYKRGYLGLWVGAEGQVYEEFDPKAHVIDRFPIPPDWTKYRVIDFGYTHPFVCQWWAEDEDGRLYMYRELYHSKRTVREHCLGNPDLGTQGIIALTGSETIRATICDWDAEDRATLVECGLNDLVKADKRVQVGVEKVQERLRIRDDHRPRIFFMRDSLVEEDDELKTEYRPTNTVQEFGGYIWPSTHNKVEQQKDERPIKKDDHGMDALRYMVMHRDGGKGGQVQVHRYA